MLLSPLYTQGHWGSGRCGGHHLLVLSLRHGASCLAHVLLPDPTALRRWAPLALPPNPGTKITLLLEEAQPRETQNVAAGTQEPLNKHEPPRCYHHCLLLVHTPNCPNSSFRSGFTLIVSSPTCPRSCPVWSQSTEDRVSHRKMGSS